MVQDMIRLANLNAEKGAFSNVGFQLGEIESLPIADSIADVIISNCVVNLSTYKEKVFKEANRVLKPSKNICID